MTLKNVAEKAGVSISTGENFSTFTTNRPAAAKPPKALFSSGQKPRKKSDKPQNGLSLFSV